MPTFYLLVKATSDDPAEVPYSLPADITSRGLAQRRCRFQAGDVVTWREAEIVENGARPFGAKEVDGDDFRIIRVTGISLAEVKQLKAQADLADEDDRIGLPVRKREKRLTVALPARVDRATRGTEYDMEMTRAEVSAATEQRAPEGERTVMLAAQAAYPKTRKVYDPVQKRVRHQVELLDLPLRPARQKLEPGA